jgi:hypothetical protein
MEFINTLTNQINSLVWGQPMLALILGSGLFLMLRLKFMPLSKIGAGFILLWRGRKKGGPLMHVIAAKAVCFKEALEPSFKVYQQQVIDNAKAMAEVFIQRGYDVISGGTDKHLSLVSLIRQGSVKTPMPRSDAPALPSTRTPCLTIRSHLS